MARGQVALLDGEVDDLVRSAAVAGRIDVGGAGLLPPVDENLSVGRRAHARGRQPQPGGVGLPAEGVQEVFGAPGHGLAGAVECHRDPARAPADPGDLAVGQDLDAFVREGLADHAGGLL